MNLFSYFLDVVAAALRGLQAAGKIAGDVDMARVSVELPRDPTHGDLSPMLRWSCPKASA